MSRSLLDLTAHEKVLLVLYRVAPMDARAALDGALFDAWTHTPCSIKAEASNTKFRTAVRQLHAEHLGSTALSGFATFWTKVGAR